MEIKLTAVFQKVPEGYIGFVEELPGANTQGATLEEARENLREAVQLNDPRQSRGHIPVSPPRGSDHEPPEGGFAS